VLGDVHVICWWGDLIERDHPENIGVDGRIILKLNLKESDEKSWAGFFWLRSGAVGRALVIALTEMCVT
jgi:hypothetical protein